MEGVVAQSPSGLMWIIAPRMTRAGLSLRYVISLCIRPAREILWVFSMTGSLPDRLLLLCRE